MKRQNESHFLRSLFLLIPVALIFSCIKAQNSNHGITTKQAALWLTNPDKSSLFQQQNIQLVFSNTTNTNPTIKIDDQKSFQTIDGFGFCLTGGSAFVINKMNRAQRISLLKELFDTAGNSIGISYLRVSIGASDLNDHVYSYNDLPSGETDLQMEKFSLDPDRADVIPVLKEILAINPAIKILGSPWSPPTWMKTTNNSKGGSLRPEFQDAYARYFVKYIQEMKAEGIQIDAITVQNEPLHPGNNPSLLMLAKDQANFIKNYLGPAFKSAGINTKIIVYDHNADRIDYPLDILNDPGARKFVDGSAFHLYAGAIEELTKVHDAFPDKHLYFTEQWIGAPGNFHEDLAWHIKTLIIGAVRNWCRTVLEWNLAADPDQNPHTPGGCDRCLGALTIDGNNVVRNPAYYIIAHASKFVRPGSVRIASNIPGNLQNVAFKAPNGNIIIIVQNDSKASQTFNISYKNKNVTTTLNAGTVGTYIWQAEISTGNRN